MNETQMMYKLWDVYQIQQLMSRYEYYHAGGLHRECIELFSSREDVSVEIANLGIYDGQAGLRRFFLGANEYAEKTNGRTGHMHLHTLTTPVIEVAGDRQTAQAVWYSPGCESAPGMMPDSWCWVKYGVDFIQEDGVWKMWHFHMYRIFTMEYNKSWAEGEYVEARFLPEHARPDRPNSYRWEYSRENEFENIPAPPKPYETWNNSMAYVPMIEK